MALRGHNQHDASLGDVMRAARAAMGRSLIDAERELRIKASVLQSVETGDLAGFPNRPVVAGYVRSYARYLGLDPDRVYRRFCLETGFNAPNGATPGAGAAGQGRARARAASPFDDSRFAAPPMQTRFGPRVPLGSVVSGLTLVALVAGLGYGGWALLQNIQRVGFAPLPEAPEVVAEAPRFVAPGYAGAGRPDAAAYAEDGALAAVHAPDDQPPIRRRDGPISEIDPGRYGVFAGAPVTVEPRQSEGTGLAAGAAVAPGQRPEGAPVLRAAALLAGESAATAAADAEAPRAGSGAATDGEADLALADLLASAALEGIAIHAVNEAWIRVRNADRAIVFEGLLAPGERYDLPPRVLRGTLRAGNAGDVYVVIDGAPYGPVGRPGGVVKNVSLAEPDVRETYAEADRAVIGTFPEDVPLTATAARR